MIAYIEGTVLTKRKESLVVLASSIGYEVSVIRPERFQRGSQVSFFTYQQFKEDGQALFGLDSEEQYDLFTLLIGVKGLGCKTVMNMLSAMDTQDIIQAIENADTAALKKLPGIGAKTAGQIILDLKGKIVVEESKPKEPKPVLMPVQAEVNEALISLGYRQADIDALHLNDLGDEQMDTATMLRLALKQLAGRKKF